MFKHIFKSFVSDQTNFSLANKQLSALQLAVNNNYYSWPRKITLEELSNKIGIKRRTFQENLRKAEAKVFPNTIKNIFNKKNN